MSIILALAIPIFTSIGMVVGMVIGVNRGWADGKLAFRRYCVRTHGEAWTDARYDAAGDPK